MKKIPFHIVSGFLGSGKTTFVKKIIEANAGTYKLGIIQNEFAASDIDGAELKSTGKDFHLLRMNKGSVFCVCLLGDFNRALEKFIDEYRPEVVVLETTGLADTTSVAEVLTAGSLSHKIYLATNWCVVDAFHFSKAGLMKQRITHQIRMADVVLLNKTDMVEDVGQVEQEVKEMNPFATIKRTVHCNIEFDPESMPVQKFYLDSVKPMERPDIHSMVIKSSRKSTPEQVMQFLRQWAPLSYRIKGYINLKNGSTLAVQCVYDTIEVKEMAGSFYSTEMIALTGRFTLREWNQSFRGIT
jgi:G3E family GTPase